MEAEGANQALEQTRDSVLRYGVSFRQACVALGV